MAKTTIRTKAWDAFSRYIRLRDAIKTTGTKDSVECITCGAIKPAFGIGCAQAGHLIPGRTNSLLIDEKFVNAQCDHCNRGLKGNWVPYRRKMVEWYGEDAVKEVEDRKYTTKPMKKYQWQEVIDTYNKKYKDLLDTS